ncbi:MAG: fructose-6-phosphate aldolase [Bdellovibrionales bacterium RIFOXYB1_FULL_37_110]|nr:MAG: fructose-6-phosphate aldolase [Bdellovibrionales bacterium RIFOXYA1_FULL_38_20]OFZ51037.1 MAG: fructose-6-phosphate aldolase [Bdellovibrionales bacterium RIFOXYC1_FULL_37_79]OFZ60249.1 MAG: fructose-6-phosphate aldolase [Bdellovibrionales bacterium RIFOXYB1_FULL_37_110]OFZ63244.1 MAG: fructose-6-phosphate aldolase [Bdellovibrionales bacterium RIFOXYD1_FULL_36_51]
MQIFIDTGSLEEIKEVASFGIIDGVTTNPSLIAKTGQSRDEIITEIVKIIDGPISAEVISTDSQGMIEEGKMLSKIHKNVTIKVPMTIEGIKACKWFSENKIKTNVTLVFSSNQALLAAKAGATYVSPFIGRLDDIGHDGMNLIEEIRQVFDNYGFTTQILAASIRHPDHVRVASMVGADVATVPFDVIKKLYNHVLTDKGLESFLKDYKKSIS